MLSFFQLDVLDENWDLIESVSEGLSSNSFLEGGCPVSNEYVFEEGQDIQGEQQSPQLK